MSELEAERYSLDSLGAFTDELYCGPAVTRGMHSNDTRSQMSESVGSGLTSKARGPVYTGIQMGQGICRCSMLTSVAAL